MCERNNHRLPLTPPNWGTWPITQACALTRNGTSDLSVHRPVLSPLSHASQGGLMSSVPFPCPYFLLGRKKHSVSFYCHPGWEMNNMGITLALPGTSRVLLLSLAAPDSCTWFGCHPLLLSVLEWLNPILNYIFQIVFKSKHPAFLKTTETACETADRASCQICS